MVIYDILRPECIEAGAAVTNKSEALSEVARIAKNSDVFKDISQDQIASALQEREQLGSTGFGKGIAIPHCRLKNISEFVIGIVTVPDGVEFEALDEEKVKLITFIIGPDRETNEHIRILSAISRILNNPDVVHEIITQTDPTTIFESFLRYSRDNVATKERKGKQLCQVYIQDESLFEDIVSVFAATESSSVTIIEGKNVREFFSIMPLFAGFYSDSHLGFNRIITAVIDKSYVNGTLREIESIVGSLDSRSDIMVIIQDIFYTAGSLKA